MVESSVSEQKSEIIQIEYWTSFHTVLGMAGVAWTDKGLTRLLLPEKSVTSLKSTLHKLVGKPESNRLPEWIKELKEQIKLHFDGKIQDFSKVSLDLSSVGSFQKRVYDVTKRIEPGKIKSYGEIAQLINSPGAARAVGGALGRNPIGLIIPCHRVISSNGKLGGFSATGKVKLKEKILILEGVNLK